MSSVPLVAQVSSVEYVNQEKVKYLEHQTVKNASIHGYSFSYPLAWLEFVLWHF